MVVSAFIVTSTLHVVEFLVVWYLIPMEGLLPVHQIGHFRMEGLFAVGCYIFLHALSFFLTITAIKRHPRHLPRKDAELSEKASWVVGAVLLLLVLVQCAASITTSGWQANVCLSCIAKLIVAAGLIWFVRIVEQQVYRFVKAFYRTVADNG
jgi:hypothetical protein